MVILAKITQLLLFFCGHDGWPFFLNLKTVVRVQRPGAACLQLGQLCLRCARWECEYTFTLFPSTEPHHPWRRSCSSASCPIPFWHGAECRVEDSQFLTCMISSPGLLLNSTKPETCVSRDGSMVHSAGLPPSVMFGRWMDGRMMGCREWHCIALWGPSLNVFGARLSKEIKNWAFPPVCARKLRVESVDGGINVQGRMKKKKKCHEGSLHYYLPLFYFLLL